MLGELNPRFLLSPLKEQERATNFARSKEQIKKEAILENKNILLILSLFHCIILWF